MRKINFLLAGIATLFMASCSNDEPANNNGGTDNGKGGNSSYLAVKIANPTDSRAAADGYEDGTGDETKINSIVFYLFNQDGSPFDLLDPATGNSKGTNKVAPAIGDNTENTDGDDIEGKYKPILVLTHRVGEIPAYIAAVANPPAGLTEKMSESDLKEKLENYGSGFIMSNAMISGGKFTEVKAENLSTDATAAEKNPITINIERVVARLDVNLQNGATNGYYAIANTDVDGDPIYARLDGWTLHNTASTSHLFKNVTFSTDPTWNWSNDHRSFWANTTGATIDSNDDNWDEVTVPSGKTYIQENTDQDKPTTLIVKATLGKLTEGNFEAVTVTQWNGVRYAGENNLKTAMVAYLKGQPATSRLYYLKETTADGNVYETIPAEALAFEVEKPSAAENNYQVIAKIASTYTEALYTADAAEKNFTSITKTDADTHLKNVLKTALIWGNGTTKGATYYQIPIKHTIAGLDDKNPTGIVRNHVYQINIKSVGGLGTPVYNPDQVIIPDDLHFENSSMYAEIRVLSWRLVLNDVDLGK